MWGIFGLGLSYLVDAWSKNTSSGAAEVREYYDRQDRELSKLDPWGQVRYQVKEKQKMMHNISKHEVYTVHWNPKGKNKRIIKVSEFDTYINEVYWTTDLPLDDFVVDYLMQVYKAQGLEMFKCSPYCFKIHIFDRQFNETICRARRSGYVVNGRELLEIEINKKIFEPIYVEYNLK